MDRRRPMVLILSAGALAAGVFVVLGIVGTAHASGRSSLTKRARAFTQALEASAEDVRDLERFLAPGVSIRDVRVLEALRALRGTLREGALVSDVRTTGGTLGETDVLALSASRPGAAAGKLTFAWSRTPGGTWVLDPVAR